MLLPSLVFSSQVESTRVLEIRREDNGLVTSFARKLDPKIPGIESNENEVEVL
jgi:hypothetical protein